MVRMHEVYQNSCVYGGSLAASTPAASAFVDTAGALEVEFLAALASLSSGKKLTVGVYTSDVEVGTDAVKVAEAVFTAESAKSAPVVSVSYRPTGLHGRYVGVKVEHDDTAARLCAVLASVNAMYRPANNDWTMEV